MGYFAWFEPETTSKRRLANIFMPPDCQKQQAA